MKRGAMDLLTGMLVIAILALLVIGGLSYAFVKFGLNPLEKSELTSGKCSEEEQCVSNWDECAEQPLILQKKACDPKKHGVLCIEGACRCCRTQKV